MEEFVFILWYWRHRGYGYCLSFLQRFPLA